MKLLIVGLTACLAMGALADRLLRIPTASLLDQREGKFEFAYLGGDSRRNFEWLQWGVTDRFELQGFRETDETHRAISTIDAEWNVLPLVPAYIPGISVGVRDVFGESALGTGFYVAITHHLILEGQNPLGRDFLLHLGYGFGSIRGLVFGFELPLTNNITFLAEHDSRQVNAALEWAPVSSVRLRGYMLDSRLHLGIVLQNRF